MLHRYCGTYGEVQARDECLTGAGHPSDEDHGPEFESKEELSSKSDGEDSEHHELQERITADLWGNIKHKPIKVSRHSNPFEDLNPKALGTFETTLRDIQDSRWMPEWFRLCSNEWEDDEYP
ncbi:hypothetical protein K439DRAFT_1615123 [Ramaria rubella]|nr:hypothetical protein K439DRAFT_1615123 [Ramaria rubella]